MKSVINGKLFDTSKMEVLIERDCHNNGNYIGAQKLLITKSGLLAFVQESNDPIAMGNSLEAVDKPTAMGLIDGWDVDDEAEAALMANGLIAAA